SGNAEWTGTVNEIRFDPTKGGTGDFYLDSLRLLDKTSNRYTLNNGYYSISGVDGLIDTMQFDPTGLGNYSNDLLANNMYFVFEMNGTRYPGTTPVTWSISGTTLQINNIGFGSSGITGSWTIQLDGKRLRNSYTITSNADGKVIERAGITAETLWANEGYYVNTLQIPFSKMIDSNGLYRASHLYKRTTGINDRAFNLGGNWIEWQGANGFNFNLKFFPSSKALQPEASKDLMYMNFSEKGGFSNTLNASQSLTHTLDFDLLPSTNPTPSRYVKYEGGDSTVTNGLNDIFFERNYGWSPGGVNPDWYEWESLQRSWVDDNLRDGMENNYSQVKQDPNGYVYTWGDSPGWPFPTDVDSNHYITTSANLINGHYNYFMNSGDLNVLKFNITRLRSAMDFLLTLYNTNQNLFIITQANHNGRDASIGSNYWDILPFGYKSAYDNIYGYVALKRMAEIETMLGNTTRAGELNTKAANLKTAYNNTFWSTNHYVMNIDVDGVTRDYGGVWINLEAIAYGLADTTRANTIMNYLQNTNTSAGTNDVFTKFIFAPRATMFNDPSRTNGGWWMRDYDGNGTYSSNQIQNGGTIFYTAYYELMSRLRSTGADDAYSRLQAMVNRFNLDHLSGGNPLYYGETNQFHGEGLVGTWGDFPESGLVPVAVKNGFMGISADKDGLHVKPNFPSSGMTSLTLNYMTYWGMKLKITASNSSVRIQALENNSPYTDWKINGTAVSGLFDQTISISSGGTVTLARTTTTYDLSTVSIMNMEGKVSVDNEYTIYINGKIMRGTDKDWSTADNMRAILKNGVNTVAITATNIGDTPAGVIADFTLPDGTKLVTDTSWKVSKAGQSGWNELGFNDGAWGSATDLGAYGVSPWGTNVVGFPTSTTARWIWSSSPTNMVIYLRKTFNYQLPTVSTSSSVENTDYGRAKAVDGIRISRNGAKGWSSGTLFSTAANTEWINLNLGSTKKVNQVVLYPSVNTNYGADAFPVDFVIQISTDNSNWTTVKTITNYVVSDAMEPQVFNFKASNAIYVRVTATKLGSLLSGGYKFQLVEMEVNNR
ncbi:MAG TPA: discoidin domain-containing protein, partial [Bacilli bacterium]